MEPWRKTRVFDKGCPGERLKTLVGAIKAALGLRASQWFGANPWVKGGRGPRQSQLSLFSEWAALLSPVAHPLSVAQLHRHQVEGLGRRYVLLHEGRV